MIANSTQAVTGVCLNPFQADLIGYTLKMKYVPSTNHSVPLLPAQGTGGGK